MSLIPLHLILQHPPFKCWEHGCAAPCPRGLPTVFLKEEGSFQVWDPSPIANSTDNKSRGGEQDGKTGNYRLHSTDLGNQKDSHWTNPPVGDISVTSPCVSG